MELLTIITLENHSSINDNEKFVNTFEQFQNLLQILRHKNLSNIIIHRINMYILELNHSTLQGSFYIKDLKRKQTDIIKVLEKEFHIVPKNYYRNMWMAIGMTIFGLPLGTVLGLSLQNMGLIGIGLPIGLAIGAAVGSAKDKKASESGNQLDIEIKH